MRTVFFTGAAVALATTTVAFRTAVFFELMVFLVECLPDWVVIAPSEKGRAAAASIVRDRTMAWRLRYKQFLAYMRFRARAETNILHHVMSLGQVTAQANTLPESIVRPGPGLESGLAKA